MVAGLQRELGNDAGPGSAGQDSEASGAAGAGAGAGAGGSAGRTQTSGAAGAGGSGASSCDEPYGYFSAWQIVQDDCVVNDERLLRALEDAQRFFMIFVMQPVGEERQFEPCDWDGTFFYEDPNQSMRWIVCESRCAALEDWVTRVGEQIAACRLDAGTAP